MRKALPFLGAAALLAAAALPSLASPKMTARTVTNGFVRSNVLLPIGGSKPIDNPVPPDLSDLSGWTYEELEAGLQKEYDVDVVAVANFLYSDQGVEFLSESIQGSNYTPYYSQANSVQSVRSAIILDAADGKLSSYGMMANLPVDQRLQAHEGLRFTEPEQRAAGNIPAQLVHEHTSLHPGLYSCCRRSSRR